MRTRFKWTRKNDLRLAKEIDLASYNKTKAFKVMAKKLGITPKMCCNRWYNHLSNPESKYYLGCRFTLISKYEKLENRTRENKTTQPEKIDKSIWAKLKKLLHFG